MNYIELINNFWRLNKEYSFTPNEKAVYFAILNKCNELGWKNPFNQSNGYLAMDSGLGESALSKARNTLKQKGLIDFKPGDGRRNNTIYSIKGIAKNDLSCDLLGKQQEKSEKGTNKGRVKKDLSDTLSCNLSGDLSDENCTDNTKQETKLNKTKLNKKKSETDFMQNPHTPASEKKSEVAEIKKENTPPVAVAPPSPYGDGELHQLCRKYATDHKDAYPAILYKDFLNYWTAPIQNGKKTEIGKERWRIEKTFQLASRLSTWYHRNPNQYQTNGIIKQTGLNTPKHLGATAVFSDDKDYSVK